MNKHRPQFSEALPHTIESISDAEFSTRHIMVMTAWARGPANPLKGAGMCSFEVVGRRVNRIMSRLELLISLSVVFKIDIPVVLFSAVHLGG